MAVAEVMWWVGGWSDYNTTRPDLWVFPTGPSVAKILTKNCLNMLWKELMLGGLVNIFIFSIQFRFGLV